MQKDTPQRMLTIRGLAIPDIQSYDEHGIVTGKYRHWMPAPDADFCGPDGVLSVSVTRYDETHVGLFVIHEEEWSTAKWDITLEFDLKAHSVRLHSDGLPHEGWQVDDRYGDATLTVEKLLALVCTDMSFLGDAQKTRTVADPPSSKVDSPLPSE